MTEQKKVTAIRVVDANREKTLPMLFGPNCVVVENTVFNFAAKLSTDYRAAYWEFDILDNGGFYMVPCQHETMTAYSPGLQRDVVLSPEAYGIACCLFAYSNLSFYFSEKRQNQMAELMGEHYHKLLEYVRGHAEAEAIRTLSD